MLIYLKMPFQPLLDTILYQTRFMIDQWYSGTITPWPHDLFETMKVNLARLQSCPLTPISLVSFKPPTGYVYHRQFEIHTTIYLQKVDLRVWRLIH